jgi:hypothetical protein
MILLKHIAFHLGHRRKPCCTQRGGSQVTLRELECFLGDTDGKSIGTILCGVIWWLAKSNEFIIYEYLFYYWIVSS